MQTGTKKTSDRFQNYFCPAAANDIVHHAYAWIVKEPNMQPKFLYCRAIDDPANDRGWNIIAEVWERDVLGSTPCKNSWMPSETQIRDIDTSRSPWQLNVSATTGRAPRMARSPTPSPALPHRNASTTITGAWRTLSLPKTLSCTPNRLRTVQRGFQKTVGTSTPKVARLPSQSRFSIGSRVPRNSAHEPVPPPSSRA